MDLILGSTIAQDVQPQSRVETPNLTFMDMNEEAINDNRANFDTSSDMLSGMDLKSFLNRPVNIGFYKWDMTKNPQTGTSYFTPFNPWKLFLNNSTIKYKLNNYPYLRGNLRVKLVVSSQPFYYGAVIAAYLPLPNFRFDPAYCSHDVTRCAAYSQRQHVWLYPQTNTGGEMVLPFFWPRQYLDITRASEVDDMGIINMQVVNQLSSANGAASGEVNIQVFAWMEDVELHGSTASLSMQSKKLSADGKDEYDGVISGPASAVAAAAGKLTTIPAIAPLATAAQIGASAVAKMTSLFGYSNTPVIDDVKPYKPSAFPHVASPEISFPIEKLSLDPKNELTIDPRIAGLKGIDELNMKHMLTKESLIDTFFINLAQEPNVSDNSDLLWTARVNPNNYIVNSYGLSSSFEILPTPAAWIAQLFQFWRGDLIYKFVFICSKYHKGKVRIMWDPTGSTANNIIKDRDTATILKNVIVDLSETTEIEFRVPYAQTAKYLRFEWNCNDANKNGPFLDTPSYDVDKTYRKKDDIDNGMIAVRLFNKFTAPADTANVTCNVFVRCAENMDYAGPRNLTPTDNPSNTMTSYFAPQSLLLEPIEGEREQESFGESQGEDKDISLECFGEKITNLRQLLRRTHFHSYHGYGPGVSDYLYIFSISHRRYPGGPGYVGTSLWSAPKQDGTGSVGFAWCKMTPIAWLMEGFLGVRGSVNWTYNAYNVAGPRNHLRAYRSTTYNNTGMSRIYQSTATNNFSAWSRLAAVFTEGGGGGHALTNGLTNAGLSVSAPMYNMCLFETVDKERPWTAKSLTPYDGGNESRLFVELMGSIKGGTNANDALELYCSAGSDFQLLYFINAPLFYQYANIPA